MAINLKKKTAKIKTITKWQQVETVPVLDWEERLEAMGEYAASFPEYLTFEELCKVFEAHDADLEHDGFTCPSQAIKQNENGMYSSVEALDYLGY